MRCGVGDERFLQPKPVMWAIVLSNFFKKVRLFSTLVKNQSSETAVPYKTAVLFTLYGCFLHLVKIHFFQNSRTKQPYFSLCLHVRLFQHLVKIKKINFLKINFFKYLYTLHSTLGRVWQSQKYGCFFTLKKN